MGTQQNPFASLERVRDEIRLLKRAGKTGSFYVFLCQGTFSLDNTFKLSAEDSATKKHPVVYSAFNDEKVSIHGGTSLPVEKREKIRISYHLCDFCPPPQALSAAKIATITTFCFCIAEKTLLIYKTH
jgi:hypothetical protein